MDAYYTLIVINITGKSNRIYVAVKYVLSQVIFVFFCFGYANVANEVETKEK